MKECLIATPASLCEALRRQRQTRGAADQKDVSERQGRTGAGIYSLCFVCYLHDNHVGGQVHFQHADCEAGRYPFPSAGSFFDYHIHLAYVLGCLASTCRLLNALSLSLLHTAVHSGAQQIQRSTAQHIGRQTGLKEHDESSLAQVPGRAGPNSGGTLRRQGHGGFFLRILLFAARFLPTLSVSADARVERAKPHGQRKASEPPHRHTLYQVASSDLFGELMVEHVAQEVRATKDSGEGWNGSEARIFDHKRYPSETCQTGAALAHALLEGQWADDVGVPRA